MNSAIVKRCPAGISYVPVNYKQKQEVYIAVYIFKVWPHAYGYHIIFHHIVTFTFSL